MTDPGPLTWMKLCVDELAREMAQHPRSSEHPLTITAVALDAQGYDEDGLYYGVGIPLFRVEWSWWDRRRSTGIVQSTSYATLDTYGRAVRAPSKELLATALIEKLGAWGREIMCDGFLREACELEPGHEGNHWNSIDGHWAEKG